MRCDDCKRVGLRWSFLCLDSWSERVEVVTGNACGNFGGVGGFFFGFGATFVGRDVFGGCDRVGGLKRNGLR